MAPLPFEIIVHAKKYLDALNERGFAVIAAYLFASYARGDWNEWSDIDIAIVSPAFEGSAFWIGKNLSACTETLTSVSHLAAASRSTPLTLKTASSTMK